MSARPTNDSIAQASEEWIDTAFYSKTLGKAGNLWRMIWLLVVPPEGHRIMPTLPGYALMLVSFGLGSAAYNTSSNVLFMALSLLLSSLILSGLMSTVNFRGTRWRLRLPQHFRVGDEASVWIDVNNQKSFLPTYSIWFNTLVKKEKTKERIHLQKRLDAKTEEALQWRFIPKKRGDEVLSISGLESQFPFGFLKKTIGGGIKKEITVLPKRINYEFKMPVGFRSHHQGDATNRFGGSAELINIRNYQLGDPQRLVHWKATARTKQLMVKQMSEESRDGYTLFVETASSIWLDAEQFETLCSFVVSLAEDLFREGRLVGAAINDEPLMLIKKVHDLRIFLNRIAGLEPIEHYLPSSTEDMSGLSVIRFKPGTLKKVNAYVGGNITGTA